MNIDILLVSDVSLVNDLLNNKKEQDKSSGRMHNYYRVKCVLPKQIERYICYSVFYRDNKKKKI